ncbi:glycolate oxidase subunit GlcE [Aestuariivirga litoralis]|uniref:Glycolate oxidase subunit GlcE n=1 Tax=Aestuariivirga litoralis TaxID=2650924 RepID=A0A2W2B8J2_9HYPH|nr:glycolate oxidase subunit GlcE [Aestuariivirga litoralis]PZF76624.1 glycolate oxidase subunit GlcE [Aestuariivirga litoralis]
MGAVLKPATPAELAEMIAAAEAPLEIIGTGTRRHIGHPVQAAATLDMSGFSGIIAYEPEELILDVQAGTPLAEIETMLAARGQQLAFEPPDFSALLGAAHSGSIGGLVASNLSGPRRIKAGAVRDHILGVHGVTGAGNAFKAGARVVKNVTGYDMPKLVTGSWGTLAALTSVILKVLPAPETEETVVLRGLDDAQAVEAMSLAMQSPCEVSAAAYVPDEAVYLRLEGIAPSVAYRRDQLGRVLKRPIEVMAAKSSATTWKAIRDGAMFAGNPRHPLWRISVAPSDAPGIISALRDKLDIRYLFDWAGGLVWLEVPPSHDATEALVRGSFRAGHGTLVRAPEATRAAVNVFQPQEAALAALSARVKDAFDPRHILNPGRMYRGL